LLNLIDGFDGVRVCEHPGYVVYAVRREVIEFAVGAVSRYFLGGYVGVSLSETRIFDSVWSSALVSCNNNR
jgi:hypothetical protein